MSLFGWKEKKQIALQDVEINKLRERVAELQELLTPEHREIEWLKNEIYILKDKQTLLNSEYESIKVKLDAEHEQEKAKYEALEVTIKEKEAQIIELDDEILYQKYALYKPQYDFASSDLYKDRLDKNRKQQKKMIKQKTAATCYTKWTVNGSTREGAKMTNHNIKQIIRTFNTDCENAIDRVKFNNYDSMLARIQRSFDSLNSLNEVNAITISHLYLNLKQQELMLAHEYAMKKQEEKDEERYYRELLREQRKVEKEIEEKRKALKKEQIHIQNDIETKKAQMATANENDRADLQSKIDEQNTKLEEIAEAYRQIDYREANQKAGYVYVISNMGAFGKNIFKIGMTRRLEPRERIRELSGASVPYPFDTHALIFSDDAPRLEAALHRAFEEHRINAVNIRKEFFNVSLEEIKRVVRENYDKSADFIDLPEAEHYRQSIRMRSLAVGEYQESLWDDEENEEDE